MTAELVLIPANRLQIAAAAKRARALVQRRALISAGAVLVPLPGFDIATDVGLLIRLITRINREFGLTPEQIDRLDAGTRVLLYQSVVGAGATMIGRLVTSDLVLRAMQSVSARVGAKQAAKYLPVAGQALSAALSYSAMWYVGERHIRDCMGVVESVLDIGPWLNAERID